MKNILIITPMAAEQENMLNALNNYPLPLLNAYTIRRGYVGKVYAAASTALALAEEQFDLVAVIGYAAGTLGFKQGEIVMPNSVPRILSVFDRSFDIYFTVYSQYPGPSNHAPTGAKRQRSLPRPSIEYATMRLELCGYTSINARAPVATSTCDASSIIT